MSIKPTYTFDSFETYLGNKQYISSSDVKNFLSSPAYYYWNKYEALPEEPKRHFAVGSAFHELALEPHKFNSNYCVSQKYDMRTKIGSAAMVEFLKQHEGKKLLLEDEFSMIEKMAASASKNKTFQKLIEHSHREMSIYTTDEQTGLKIKLRPDILQKYEYYG